MTFDTMTKFISFGGKKVCGQTEKSALSAKSTNTLLYYENQFKQTEYHLLQYKENIRYTCREVS